MISNYIAKDEDLAYQYKLLVTGEITINVFLINLYVDFMKLSLQITRK